MLLVKREVSGTAERAQAPANTHGNRNTLAGCSRIRQQTNWGTRQGQLLGASPGQSRHSGTGSPGHRNAELRVETSRPRRSPAPRSSVSRLPLLRPRHRARSGRCHRRAAPGTGSSSSSPGPSAIPAVPGSQWDELRPRGAAARQAPGKSPSSTRSCRSPFTSPEEPHSFQNPIPHPRVTFTL